MLKRIMFNYNDAIFLFIEVDNVENALNIDLIKKPDLTEDA